MSLTLHNLNRKKDYSLTQLLFTTNIYLLNYLGKGLLGILIIEQLSAFRKIYSEILENAE